MDSLEKGLVSDKRKYYHGWHLVNGTPYSFTWIEDEGYVIGGIPTLAPGTTKLEITKEEFYLPTLLSDLEKENPYPDPAAVTDASRFPEDGSG